MHSLPCLVSIVGFSRKRWVGCRNSVTTDFRRISFDMAVVRAIVEASNNWNLRVCRVVDTEQSTSVMDPLSQDYAGESTANQSFQVLREFDQMPVRIAQISRSLAPKSVCRRHHRLGTPRDQISECCIYIRHFKTDLESRSTGGSRI